MSEPMPHLDPETQRALASYDNLEPPEPAVADEDDACFRSFEIHLTVVVSVDGSDYYQSEWDGDEEAFREEMVKEAERGMRNTDHNIGDCWLDHIEEVNP